MSREGVVVGTLVVDGRPVEFQELDTIASCLMRAGRLGLRLSIGREPRGVFCGIGVCNECLVTVDGEPNQRACQIEAKPGQLVLTSGS